MISIAIVTVPRAHSCLPSYLCPSAESLALPSLPPSSLTQSAQNAFLFRLFLLIYVDGEAEEGPVRA